jgi:DNA-binding MarR family transcriptional regulator
MQTAETLGTTLELLARWLRRLPTEGDLGASAVSTLLRVATEGPRRLTDLAAAEGLSQPGMTQLVTRLESDGLVRRGSAPQDGRVVLVEATDAGVALLERRRRQRAAALAELLAGLPPPDRETVEAALPALQRLTEAALTTLSALPASRTALPAPASPTRTPRPRTRSSA